MSIWFYYNENGDKVQVTGGQLKGLAKAGLITPETIVETEGGKQAPARKVKGLNFVEVTQPEPTPATIPTESNVYTAEEQTELDKIMKCSNTGLHGAVGRGDLEAVKYLVSTGREINKRDWCCIESGSTRYNFGDLTPLEFAKEMGHTAIVEYLESIGATTITTVPPVGTKPVPSNIIPVTDGQKSKNEGCGCIIAIIVAVVLVFNVIRGCSCNSTVPTAPNNTELEQELRELREREAERERATGQVTERALQELKDTIEKTEREQREREARAERELNATIVKMEKEQKDREEEEKRLYGPLTRFYPVPKVGAVYKEGYDSEYAVGTANIPKNALKGEESWTNPGTSRATATWTVKWRYDKGKTIERITAEILYRDDSRYYPNNLTIKSVHKEEILK